MLHQSNLEGDHVSALDELLKRADETLATDSALAGAKVQIYRADALYRRPILAAGMFRDRATQFKERLGWEALQLDDLGLEYDQYDRPDALYIAIEDAQGRHCASGRILPTTGPTMINDFFTAATGGPIRDPLTWEVTRVCLSPRLDPEGEMARAALPALFWAGQELALDVGVKNYLGVYSRPLRRVYRAIGIRTEPLGSMDSPEGPIEVALWPVCAALRDDLARRAGPLAQSRAGVN